MAALGRIIADLPADVFVQIMAGIFNLFRYGPDSFLLAGKQGLKIRNIQPETKQLAGNIKPEKRPNWVIQYLMCLRVFII
ncbi:MAG: hypothetical protein AB9834_14145 [Lentimicrobium sp.]